MKTTVLLLCACITGCATPKAPQDQGLTACTITPSPLGIDTNWPPNLSGAELDLNCKIWE